MKFTPEHEALRQTWKTLIDREINPHVDAWEAARDIARAVGARPEFGGWSEFGRIAVNVANLGRRPYRSLAADITTILQDDLGLLLRGEVVWMKGEGASGSCAWGSFQSAANPVLRDLTERVVIASKALRNVRGRSAERSMTEFHLVSGRISARWSSSASPRAPANTSRPSTLCGPSGR